MLDEMYTSHCSFQSNYLDVCKRFSKTIYHQAHRTEWMPRMLVKCNQESSFIARDEPSKFSTCPFIYAPKHTSARARASTHTKEVDRRKTSILLTKQLLHDRCCPKARFSRLGTPGQVNFSPQRERERDTAR